MRKARQLPSPKRSLLNEVLELRTDILQFLVQAQQSTVRSLKRELEQLHQQQRRVQEAEESRSQQVAQVEEQLSSPDLESESRPQVEAVKQELIVDGAEKLKAEQSSLRQREADLAARLESEVQRAQALQQRAAQVQKALGR